MKNHTVRHGNATIKENNCWGCFPCGIISTSVLLSQVTWEVYSATGFHVMGLFLTPKSSELSTWTLLSSLSKCPHSDSLCIIMNFKCKIPWILSRVVEISGNVTFSSPCCLCEPQWHSPERKSFSILPRVQGGRVFVRHTQVVWLEGAESPKVWWVTDTMHISQKEHKLEVYDCTSWERAQTY